MKKIVVLLFTALAVVAAGKEPTALELIKEANRYVGEQAKDKLLQIRSERSVGTLTPKVWYVVFHDPTATFKAVEVKFAAGKMVDVKRPFRVVELAKGAKEIGTAKVKVDSDRAIETALAEAILKDIQVKSVEARLENGTAGPLWKLKLWAAKLNKANETAEIGRITVDAEDAKVLETDIHPNRLN
jgi:cytochrome c556